MKKGNYTPGPYVETEGFIIENSKNAEGRIIADLSVEKHLFTKEELLSNKLLLKNAPELNERLLDNTAMIMRLHCVMSTEFVTPEDMKQKLQSMQSDIELCVVKNRDVLTKANVNENT